jgi:hypothetical protein
MPMEFERLDPPGDLGSPAVDAPEPGLRALVVDLCLHPRRAMTALAAHPGRRWVWPLLALVVVTACATLAGTAQSQAYSREVAMVQVQRAMKDNPEMMGDQSAEVTVGRMTSGSTGAVMTGIGVIGGVVGVVVGILVAAAVLHFVGTVLGGQQTYTQMLAVSSWAHAPFVLREILRTGAHLLGHWDPNPQGLAGLVACSPLAEDCHPSYLQPVLAQIEVWNVWYWVLLGVAVAVVCHVSWRKVVVALVVLVGLQVALGLVGVAAGRTMSGMFG